MDVRIFRYLSSRFYVGISTKDTGSLRTLHRRAPPPPAGRQQNLCDHDPNFRRFYHCHHGEPTRPPRSIPALLILHTPRHILLILILLGIVSNRSCVILHHHSRNDHPLQRISIRIPKIQLYATHGGDTSSRLTTCYHLLLPHMRINFYCDTCYRMHAILWLGRVGRCGINRGQWCRF